MNIIRRCAALLAAAAMAFSLLSACGAGESKSLSLTVSMGAPLETLDPIYAEGPGDQTVLAHLYENLMRLTVGADGTLSVTNGMAKSVDVKDNPDGTVTYTFRLRSARWSDGKNVQAGDFVYAWKRLADPGSDSPYAGLMRVVSGYQEARAQGDMDLLQVFARNGTTLTVVLNGHHDWFLREVCTATATMPLRRDVVERLGVTADTPDAAPSEDGAADDWASDPTALVTNGPYVASESGEALRLVSNPAGSGRRNGPAELSFFFFETPEEARLFYEAGTADALWPLEAAAAGGMEGQTLRSEPELAACTVLFNHTLFQDENIRRAMSLSIDRVAVAAAAGDTASAAEGLIPPGVPEGEEEFRRRDFCLLENDAEGYAERCTEAWRLLWRTGYQSGLDLTNLTCIYVDGPAGRAVAAEVCRMWEEVLDLHVTPVGVQERELWAAVRSGNYDLCCAEVKAVCGDAECFLMDWVTGADNNVIGYRNSAYDTLMQIVSAAADSSVRMGCLHDAEELLVEIDCALAPLYTESVTWAMREDLTGAFRDPRGWLSFAGAARRSAE